MAGAPKAKELGYNLGYEKGWFSCAFPRCNIIYLMW